jgi:glyoxylase-like metal-dependent hydrolase (beta-lactamase superfamily II)
MREAGCTPEGVDYVFVTHAHPDHVGGALNNLGEPNFPNAMYFICKAEWDFWFSEEALLLPGRWFTDFARRQLKPLQEKMAFLETEGEVLPGVHVLFAPGHTPGHMVISITSCDERLLYTGDTAIHPVHLEHPGWQSIYDLQPSAAATSKQRIFDLAATTGSWVLGQHFPPFPNLGKVIKVQKGWKWIPAGADEPG